jgi:hypothetical protein
MKNLASSISGKSGVGNRAGLGAGGGRSALGGSGTAGGACLTFLGDFFFGGDAILDEEFAPGYWLASWTRAREYSGRTGLDGRRLCIKLWSNGCLECDTSIFTDVLAIGDLGEAAC